MQDISTQQLITSVHTITRQLSLYNQHDMTKSGVRRSKSCFTPAGPPPVKKRSKSVAGDLPDQRRQRRTEVRQTLRESSRQEKLKSSPSRALRRVKTFLKPFRKTYKLERSPEIELLG